MTTMAVSNTAIYLGEDGKLLIRQITDDYEPKGSQVLVKVQYSAINPADLRHFFMGMSDFVAGYDWVGVAVKAGITCPFKPGQQLFGMTLPGNRRPITSGAHQDFLIAEPEWTYSLPAGLEPSLGVTFPVGVQTSIDALFNQLGFAFPPLGLAGANPIGEAILIWGGASSLGQAAIQLARAAGFQPIITTASSRNHDKLHDLGATHCFDYRSANVVDNIRTTVQKEGKQLKAAFDTVATGLGFAEGLSQEELLKVAAEYENSSPAMTKRCCNSGVKLKLCASLLVEKDSEWSFPIPYRLAEGDRPVVVPGLETLFENVDREWGNRVRAIREWMLNTVPRNWIPMAVRVVQGANPGIQAIQDVFNGKASGEKLVIQHPL